MINTFDLFRPNHGKNNRMLNLCTLEEQQENEKNKKGKQNIQISDNLGSLSSEEIQIPFHKMRFRFRQESPADQQSNIDDGGFFFDTIYGSKDAGYVGNEENPSGKIKKTLSADKSPLEELNQENKLLFDKLRECQQKLVEREERIEDLEFMLAGTEEQKEDSLTPAERKERRLHFSSVHYDRTYSERVLIEHAIEEEDKRKSMQRSMNQFQKEINGLNKDLASLVRERNSLQEQNRVLVGDRMRLERTVKRLEKQVRRYDPKELEKEFEAANVGNDVSMRYVKTLQKKIEGLEKEVGQLQLMYSLLVSEKDEIQLEVAEHHRKMLLDFDNRMLQAEEEAALKVRGLEAELREKQRELEEKTRFFEQTVIQLQNKLKSVERQNDNALAERF